MKKLKLISKYFKNIFFKKKRRYIGMLLMDSYKDRFKAISSNNLWGNEYSVSGDGSAIAYTENITKWLPLQIQKYSIKSIVDAPCGDFNWMRHVVDNNPIKYKGIDIVDELIERNKKNYQRINIDFECGDICTMQIPDCDLLIVRDCLFHLSYSEIDKFLKNIKMTNYKYLLTSTHNKSSVSTNKDIITGDFRYIDIFSDPFNFNESLVIDRVNDCPNTDKYKREMILIKKENVPTCIY
jgi:SAM-dependent methyltransferase